jgi:hypothetical protein
MAGLPLIGKESIVYADQLSKRLEEFEKSGAFGPNQRSHSGQVLVSADLIEIMKYASACFVFSSAR